MTWLEILVLIICIIIVIFLAWVLEVMTEPAQYNPKVEPMCLECGAYNYDCDCHK